MELAKIEALASGHFADFERERERADALMAELFEGDGGHHGSQGSGGSARRWPGPVVSGIIRRPLRP